MKTHLIKIYDLYHLLMTDRCKRQIYFLLIALPDSRLYLRHHQVIKLKIVTFIKDNY